MNARIELPPAREICPTTTRRLISEGALLVDVRERAEIGRLSFDVPGLVVMPLSELERRWRELPRDRTLVLACNSGPRSLKATYFLMYQGYADVANMDGGMAKWARKGFPIHGSAVPAASESCCGGSEAPSTASSCCSSVQPAPAQACGCGTTVGTGPCC